MKIVHKLLRINYAKTILAIFAGVIFVFLVVPSIITIPMSISDTRYLVFPPKGFTLNWYTQFLTNDEWVKPTLFSLQVAVLTTLVSLTLGSMASLAIVRGSIPGKRILNLILISPIMVPIIIIAFAVYGVYAKLYLIGTTIGIVIAHTILTTPFVILVVSANLYRFDVSMEMAARNLGASAIRTFMTVTLPIIRPGIVAAGIFCFITSLDDLVLALFLMGTTKITLPVKIFSQIQFRLDPVIAAASTVFITAAFAIVIALVFIKNGKKMELIKEKKNERFE